MIESINTERAIQLAKDQFGKTLSEISEKNPVMLVFLRHFGCTFCREAVSEISKNRSKITADGTEIAFVHMGIEEQANAFFLKYNVEDASRFSDPGKRLYEAFGLGRGSLTQLIGPKVALRGVSAFFSGHGIGPIVGDSMQMPGTFLVYRGKIVKAFVNTTAGDRPNYMELSKCDVPACA